MCAAEAARIEIVVAKNSGGQATYGKIAAARALGVDVIMLRRPSLPKVHSVETMQDAVDWLDHALVLRRGTRRVNSAAPVPAARSRASAKNRQ